MKPYTRIYNSLPDAKVKQSISGCTSQSSLIFTLYAKHFQPHTIWANVLAQTVWIRLMDNKNDLLWGWAVRSRCGCLQSPSLHSCCRSLSPRCTGYLRNPHESSPPIWEKKKKNQFTYILFTRLQCDNNYQIMYVVELYGHSNTATSREWATRTYTPLSTWMERVLMPNPNSSTSATASVTSNVGSSLSAFSSSGIPYNISRGSDRSYRKQMLHSEN